MALTWREVLSKVGKIPLREVMQLEEEMLRERNMTWREFIMTEEFEEVARENAMHRFTDPTPCRVIKQGPPPEEQTEAEQK